MAFTRFSGMHRLTHSCTHSQTDRPEYDMLLAPFLNGGRSIIIKAK